MQTCHIFAAGDYSGNFAVNDGDIIIAADAGYMHLADMNILPNILVGDFDTLDNIPDNLENIVRFPTKKDYTDTHLAIEEGVKRGYKRFTVYGALGGKKLEHTFANIQLAVGYTEKGYDITLTDGETYVYVLNNSEIVFSDKASGMISVFSASDKSYGVNLTGLKYELSGAKLTNSFALGVSNEFIGTTAAVSVENGTLIIITKQRRQNNEN